MLFLTLLSNVMEEMVEENMFVVKYPFIIFLKPGKTDPIANCLEVNSVRF